MATAEVERGSRGGVQALFQPEQLQAIERAFLESQAKYTAEGSEGSEHEGDAESAWKREIEAIRERKTARIGKHYFSEDARQRIARMLRGEEEGDDEPGDVDAVVDDVVASGQECCPNGASDLKVKTSLTKVHRPPAKAHTDEPMEAARVWGRISVGSLLRDLELITAKSSTPLRSVLQTMADNDISSVPVLEESTSLLGKHSTKVVGLLDIAVIVHALVEDLRNDKSSHGIEHFMDTATAGDVLRKEGAEKSWRAIAYDDSALHLIQMFADGVHRAVVLRNNKAVGVVTRRTLMHVLAAHMDLLGPKADLKLSNLTDLVVDRSDIISVTPGTPAWIAFHEMSSNNVSGIGLVSNDGKHIRGEVSVKSLKGMKDKRVHLLARPLQELLHAAPLNMRLAIVREHDTIGTVIDKLVETRRDRVWIVKAGTKDELCGMITMKEVCQLILRE